ncbi:MAG: hypothetical protein H6620_05510 [Halobacteriovoraceae bacterium]|nr:hypothetical protein [Halobacteriovoraceae bacterium]
MEEEFSIQGLDFEQAYNCQMLLKGAFTFQDCDWQEIELPEPKSLRTRMEANPYIFVDRQKHVPGKKHKS